MPALEDFEFEYGTQRILFGKERVSDLGKELERLGATRAFVICGPNILEKSDVIDRVTRALGERLVGVFSGVQPQAPVAVAEAAAKEVEDKRADVLISVGGGSTHDTAKGVAVLLAEGGSLQDWRLKVTEPRRVHVPAMLRPQAAHCCSQYHYLRGGNPCRRRAHRLHPPGQDSDHGPADSSSRDHL